MHIRTELSNSERIGNDGATICGRSRHSVNTRISINRVLSSAIRPIIGNCVKGFSNQHSAVAVADNVIASDGQEAGQSINGIIGSKRNRRNTTIGVNNFGVHIVCTRDLVGKNQRVKVVTRNFNTVNIPNERTGSRRRSREDNLIIRTNGTSLIGRNLRSYRQRINGNLNAVHITTATIRSGNTIFIISSRRHHIDSTIMRTGVPGIDHIGIDMVAEIGTQRDVLAFTNCSGRSRDVQIGSKRGDREGHRLRHTAVRTLGNDRVHTGSGIKSGFGSCFTVPIQTSSSRGSRCRERGGAGTANDRITSKGHNRRDSVNLEIQGEFFRAASGVGIRSNHFHSMLTDTLHISGIDGVASTSDEDTVKVPSINRVHSFVRVSHFKGSETGAERRGGRADQSEGDITQRSGILLKSNRIASEVITSKVQINRKSNIFVAINRIGNIIGVGVGRSQEGAILIPFPFVRLDRTGGVSRGRQSNRGSAGTEHRSSNRSDGSRIHIEIMNRSISAFATGIDQLTIEFIGKSVGQGRQRADVKSIGGVSGTHDRLAIASPLVLDSNFSSTGLCGKGHDIILTSVVRTDDGTHNIIGNSKHHNVGSDIVASSSMHAAADRISSNRIPCNSESRTRGIRGSAIHIPKIGIRSLRAFRGIGNSKTLRYGCAKTQLLRSRRRDRSNTRIHGLGVRKERMRCWFYPTGQRCFRIFEMRRFTARLACSQV